MSESPGPPPPHDVARAAITVEVNGVPRSVPPGTDPHTKLVDFLRDTLGLTGTKIGCGEGGCGACTVAVTRQDGASGERETLAANACLLPLCSLDGAAVTTIEGIGSAATGYHKIQSALAACDGSQCGYCSPGMVMNMWSLLASSSEQTKTLGCNNSMAVPTASTVEHRLQGNICRCASLSKVTLPPSKDQISSWAVHISSCWYFRM